MIKEYQTKINIGNKLKSKGLTFSYYQITYDNRYLEIESHGQKIVIPAHDLPGGNIKGFFREMSDWLEEIVKADKEWDDEDEIYNIDKVLDDMSDE